MRPARQTPPDIKAFGEATAINGPDGKIDALEKFKADFPDSSMADWATLGAML
jgi:hypothetical protein